MFTPSADHPARRRGHGVAVAVSVLAVGAALDRRPGRCRRRGRCAAHTPSSTTHRVLSTAEHITQDRSRRVELQYFTAHNRYRLISQYGKRKKLDYRSWQKDVLGGKERAVDQVVILPDQKTWSEQKRMVTPLPAESFGIRSTPTQVARAIRDGVAQRDGLVMKDGQSARLRTLSTGKHERSALLWVDPSTLQPVAATSAYVTGGGSSLRIVSSHWENVTRHALNRLEAEPKDPAGYKVTHSGTLARPSRG
jgi:hypothetical protein